MRKLLLAVDDTRGAARAAQALAEWGKCLQPDSVLVLHVERLYGRSLVGEALESEQDLEEVSAALEGTDHLRNLEAAGKRIVTHFKEVLEKAGYRNVQPLIKRGHPAEQIVATAREEGVDLVVMGSRGGRLHSLLMGSVSGEVANTAGVSVMIVR